MSKKILVVDDSDVIRKMLYVDLTGRGYSVEQASGGRGALEKARQVQFDLIVTDQNMPGMDGLTFVKTLREWDTYAKTPIVVLTTETSDEMKAKFREAGANGWMSKPFSSERMTGALSKLLPS